MCVCFVSKRPCPLRVSATLNIQISIAFQRVTVIPGYQLHVAERQERRIDIYDAYRMGMDYVVSDGLGNAVKDRNSMIWYHAYGIRGVDNVMLVYRLYYMITHRMIIGKCTTANCTASNHKAYTELTRQFPICEREQEMLETIRWILYEMESEPDFIPFVLRNLSGRSFAAETTSPSPLKLTAMYLSFLLNTFAFNRSISLHIGRVCGILAQFYEEFTDCERLIAQTTLTLCKIFETFSVNNRMYLVSHRGLLTSVMRHTVKLISSTQILEFYHAIVQNGVLFVRQLRGHDIVNHLQNYLEPKSAVDKTTPRSAELIFNIIETFSLSSITFNDLMRTRIIPSLHRFAEGMDKNYGFVDHKFSCRFLNIVVNVVAIGQYDYVDNMGVDVYELMADHISCGRDGCNRVCYFDLISMTF